MRQSDRVGCYLSNSPSWVVASLAVWLTGAAVGAVGTLVPGPEATALFDAGGDEDGHRSGGCPELGPGPMVIHLNDAGDSARLGWPNDRCRS